MDYMKKIVYHSNYWYNDGLRKAQMRDMSGAVASLRRSLQFNRENIAARNLLGLVYYGIGEVPEALVEWIISKNLRPRDNIADYYIRTVQSSANELETMNQAIKKYNQCLGYCRQHGEDLAIIQLKKVLSLNPKLVKAHQLLALLYIRTEEYERAGRELAWRLPAVEARLETLDFGGSRSIGECAVTAVPSSSSRVRQAAAEKLTATIRFRLRKSSPAR